MNVLKTEEYTRSLPNGRWLRNMLEYEKEGLDGMMDKKWQRAVKVGAEYIRERKIELKTLTEILEQSVRVVEGKPIYLTEEQWDWLHDYILRMRSDLLFGGNYLYAIGGEEYEGLTEEEQEKAYIEWGSSLDKYTDLFEKDIDSFFETLPNETFRCVGCDKELQKRHMRICVKLSVGQKKDCICILKDEINLIKSGDYDDPDFDDEKVLMLSKNAYRRRVVVIRLSFGSLTFLYQLQYTNYNKFLRKFMVIY